MVSKAPSFLRKCWKAEAEWVARRRTTSSPRAWMSLTGAALWCLGWLAASQSFCTITEFYIRVTRVDTLESKHVASPGYWRLDIVELGLVCSAFLRLTGYLPLFSSQQNMWRAPRYDWCRVQRWAGHTNSQRALTPLNSKMKTVSWLHHVWTCYVTHRELSMFKEAQGEESKS